MLCIVIIVHTINGKKKLESVNYENFMLIDGSVNIFRD